MRSLPTLLVLLVAACRATPIPPQSRYPAGTDLTAKYVTVDGSRIRYVEAGTGPAVVFIHGFGASLYTWRHTLPPVAAAGFRAIAFDNRAFGFSDKPAHGYTNADYTRLVLALLDSLRVPDAVLVGHSMGGAIAAGVALAAPARVRGLVLMDAAGFGTRWPFTLRIVRWPLLGALATSLRARSSTASILRSTYADPTKVTGRDVDQYYGPVPDPDYGPAMRGVLREFRFDDLAGRLAAVVQPTIVLWGSGDRWIPPAIGRRMAVELPRAAFVIVPRAGHAAPEEAPELVNRSLIAFLEQGLLHVPENLASSPNAGLARSNGVHFINRPVEDLMLSRKLTNTRALRIIAVAREEFARSGFDGARIEQITRAAGVNKQLLFYYYHSKRGLFQAVLGQAAAELETALAALPAASGRPLERLERVLQAQFDFLARRPDLVAVLAQGNRTDLAPFAPAIKRLVVLLAEGQGLGQVRDDVDPHLTAAQALVLMVGYLQLESVVAASAPPLGADEPALRERWKEAAVQLVVAGVAAR